MRPGECKARLKVTGLFGRAQIQALICCNVRPPLWASRSADQRDSDELGTSSTQAHLAAVLLRGRVHVSPTTRPGFSLIAHIYNSASNYLINNMLIKI